MNKYSQLDVLHSIACGIDVHKRFVVAVIIDRSMPGEEPKVFKGRFSTFKKGLEELSDWLAGHNCFHVCMESTGVYWIPVFNVLESRMEEVRICNPKWLKLVKGEKDDSKDAAWICNQYSQGMTRSSYIPNRDIRFLRSLSRKRTKRIQSRTSEHNRLINQFTRNNYKLDMVFSNIRGKSASRIINLILSGEPYTDQDILSCVDKRCKASREDILQAVDGIEFTQREKRLLRLSLRHIKELDEEIKEIEEMLKEVSDDYRQEINLLTTVPGISTASSVSLLAEIGPDMSQFPSPSKLAKWAGVAPGSNESAGKKFSVHVTKGGKYLKPILIQCAWAAVKSKNPYFKIKFESIAARQGKKRAIMAIARKILVCIWAILSKKEEWKPKDADEDSRPITASIRKSKTKLHSALKELVAMGTSKDDLAIEFIEQLNAI